MHYFDTDTSKHFYPVTASMDWCEENYQVTPYIAEFWNTVTNAWFIAVALAGLFRLRHTQLGFRFVLAYVAFATIGVGSWLFHMTLMRSAQLLDELPMLYLVLVLLYHVIETDAQPRYGRSFPAALVAAGAAFTYVYVHVFRHPALFLLTFSLAVCYLIMRGVYLASKLPATPAKRQLAAIRRRAIPAYALASALWVADTLYCELLRDARIRAGPLWAPLLQLHGWWHIFSGAGGYLFIVSSEYYRLISLQRARGSTVTALDDDASPLIPDEKHGQSLPNEAYDVKWSFFGIVPTVVLRPGYTPNGPIISNHHHHRRNQSRSSPRTGHHHSSSRRVSPSKRRPATPPAF